MSKADQERDSRDGELLYHGQRVGEEEKTKIRVVSGVTNLINPLKKKPLTMAYKYRCLVLNCKTRRRIKKF